MKWEANIPNPVGMARDLCEKRGLNFNKMLAGALSDPHGAVVKQPGLFAIATIMPIRVGDFIEPCWQVPIAIGPLHQLITQFPFDLPWIKFTRWKGTTKEKVYRMARLKRLVASRKKG